MPFETKFASVVEDDEEDSFPFAMMSNKSAYLKAIFEAERHSMIFSTRADSLDSYK